MVIFSKQLHIYIIIIVIVIFLLYIFAVSSNRIQVRSCKTVGDTSQRCSLRWSHRWQSHDRRTHHSWHWRCWFVLIQIKKLWRYFPSNIFNKFHIVGDRQFGTTDLPLLSPMSSPAPGKRKRGSEAEEEVKIWVYHATWIVMAENQLDLTLIDFTNQSNSLISSNSSIITFISNRNLKKTIVTNISKFCHRLNSFQTSL